VTHAWNEFIASFAGMTSDYVPPTGYTQDYAIGVAYADARLVSLLTTNYMDAGGAHPNTVFTSEVFAMDGEKPRLISLDDLFTPGSGYLNALFARVTTDIKRQKKARGVSQEIWDTFTTKDLNVYTLSPRSITFVFSPYVAGAYVEGVYDVTIPYTEIARFINPDGPLARFVAQ